MNKILRHKNLMNLFYAILVGLPLFQILAKVLYVQLNRNAYQSYTENALLSNVFEDSISEIVSSGNVGEMNFFQWFTDMFIDSTNPTNLLYCNFINWYLNYALLISLVFILFLVLMWFVNFVRKLLNRGMDFGEGSY